MSTAYSRLLVLAAMCASAGFAQDHKDPQTVRDFCVRVPTGKSMEFEAYARDVAAPLAQARADSGEFMWLLIMRAVEPAGTSAKCDYRIAYGYAGLPPEMLSTDQLDAALKKANLNMSAQDLLAKRDSLSRLVSVEIWVQIDAIGPPTQKGGYVRLNHYSVKPGMMEDWTRLETTYWKALVDPWIKSGAKSAWGLYNLWMPEGDGLPYNAATVDVFADWNSLLHGAPVGELWPKVHPHTEITEVFDRLDRVRSRHDIEVFKVIELVAQTKN